MPHHTLLLRLLLVLGCILPAACGEAQPIGTWRNTGPVNFPGMPAGGANGIGRVSQIKFHPYDPSKMYAVSASGGVYFSSNNGGSWTPLPGTETLPQCSNSSICINYLNDRTLYLCLGDANYYRSYFGIWKSLDGGVSWSPTGSGNGIIAVEMLMHPTDTNIVVAATNNGIYRTANGGATWTLTQAGAFRDMKAKPVAGSKTLYATTLTGFYRSTDFGGTWTAATSGVNPPAPNRGMRIAVSAGDTARVYLAAGSGNGIIYRSNDEGGSFTQVYSSNTDCPVCYGFPGSSWQGDYNFDLNANPQHADELLLVAHNVWRSTDAGVSWSQRTRLNYDIHTDMHHIEWNPYNNKQIWNANDGGVWMSTDTGASLWSPRSDGLAATEIYTAAQSPVVRDLIFIGTQDNGELHYDHSGWATASGVSDVRTPAYFEYGTNNSLYYSLYGYAMELKPNGTGTGWNLPFPNPINTQKVALVPQLNNVAYVAKDSIWRSMNVRSASPSWQLIRANSTSQVLELASSAADSNILYVALGNNTLLRSDNALSATPTWTVITSPGSLNPCSITTSKTNPSLVFMSAFNKVYRSADKGITWKNITGTGLSGYNIRKIIHDVYSTNERLFVSDAANVYYKDSTGTAWSTAAGLPSVAYKADLMIYNDGTASSVLRVATFGRGVWESNINNHLKPVAGFTAEATEICPGDSVHFTELVHGVYSTLSWSFPGGAPAGSTAAAPVVQYAVPGVYPVTLTAGNGAGSDTKTASGYIIVSAGTPLAVAEGFEGSVYPPPGWTLSHTAYSGANGGNWYRFPGWGAFGLGYYCVFYDNLNSDIQGSVVTLLSPREDLNHAADASLSFDVAYAPDTALAHPDTLRVRLSTDCGHSWQTIYAKSGMALATAPPHSSGIFSPSATQWRTESVSLLPFVGGTIQLSFENIGHGGQAMYLDNINISIREKNVGLEGTALRAAGFKMYPNPGTGIFTISGSNFRSDEYLLRCYDITGKAVRQGTLQGSAGTFKATVDWSSLSSGIYTVSLQTNNELPLRQVLVVY